MRVSRPNVCSFDVAHATFQLEPATHAGHEKEIHA